MSTPATGRSGRCSTCRSRWRPARPSPSSARTAPARRPSPASPPGLVAPSAGSVVVDGADMTGQPAVPLRPGRRRPRPRGPVGVRHAHRRGEPRARRSAASAAGRGVRAGLERAYELFPILRRAARARSPAPCRAASSACWRWPGCSSTRPRCWSPTSCRSGWRRSSSSRSTSRSRAAGGRHVLLVDRAARRPRARAVRPGRRARPRLGVVVRSHRRRGRPRPGDPPGGRARLSQAPDTGELKDTYDGDAIGERGATG